jgi:hypothetical protein
VEGTVRRLCVFYKHAHRFLGKPSGPARRPIEWIVCKGCQRKLQQGVRLTTQFEPSWQELAKETVEAAERSTDPRPCAICLGRQGDKIHDPGYCGPRPHPYVPQGPLHLPKRSKR